MFKIGDAVFYGVHGVCTVTDIDKREFCGEMRDYYTIKPVYSKTSTVFVPIPQNGAPEKMRKVLTKDEVLALIDALPESTFAWTNDHAARKEAYSAALKNALPAELVAAVKGLYERRTEFVMKNKKMPAADERMLAEAEKMINEEFAFALEIEREQVAAFIRGRITDK